MAVTLASAPVAGNSRRDVVLGMAFVGLLFFILGFPS
jgi:hypothetical protein